MTHRLLLSNAGKETDDIAIKERKKKKKKKRKEKSCLETKLKNNNLTFSSKMRKR